MLIIVEDCKSTSAHLRPVAVDESAVRTNPLVPRVNLPGVSAAVATRMSPLASNKVLLIAVARSNAVKVIISRTSPAVSAARELMVEPSVAV
jgi:hypothetical protein